MYEFLGISIGLAALLSINAFMSLLAVTVWRVLAAPSRRWSAHTRSRILFAMRVGPAGAALFSVAALLVPSYLAYEPHATTEIVSKKLAVLALVSAAGVALALWRGVSSWFATHALLGEWLEGAEPIRIADIHIPAFRIQHPFPVIAVVGSLRPRLFIAQRVLDSLTAEEMRAAIAHEGGHLAAHDNLKRILLRACRDMLMIVPCGRSIDRAWTQNAEAAADESAANHGSGVALNLASALIEIARMVPAGAHPTMPVASFLLEDGADGVNARITRLLNLAAAGERRNCPPSKLTLWTGRVIALLLMFCLVFLLINSTALSSLHAAMEQVVRILN